MGERGGSGAPQRENSSNRWCPKHGNEYPCKECAREEQEARKLYESGRRQAVETGLPAEKKKIRADRAPFVLQALLKGLDDAQVADFVSMRVNMGPKDPNFDPAYAELRAALDQKPGARRTVPGRSEPVPSAGNLRARLIDALPKLSDHSFDKIRAEIGNTPRRAKRTG